MEYYPPPVQGTEKKDRTLVSVLLAGCGCLLIIGVIAVLLAGKFFNVMRGPTKVVKHHLEAINHGNYLLAYGQFTQKFQKNHSNEEFRRDLQGFSSILPYKEVDLKQTRIQNDRAFVDGTLVGKDGAIVPIHYELVKENDQWHISHYQWSPPGNLEKI
jgi:hypothetical protein